MAAKILLQTTTPYEEDDWHSGRFSLLSELLGNVVARDRMANESGDDPLLSHLDETDFDELWLVALDDDGNGLSKADLDGIMRFRRLGAGVLTARDHQNMGSCLCGLGTLGMVNYFHAHNPDPDPSRRENDDRDNPNISYPNYHSGANGDYQRVAVSGSVHELLRSDRPASGVIEFFPAHPHEGGVGVQAGLPARVIAQGRSTVTGRPFNLAVVIEGEQDQDGRAVGRAVATSSFHHFADYNWDTDMGCPSFVTDKPGHEIKHDPSRLEIFKDYVRNIARWLSQP